MPLFQSVNLDRVEVEVIQDITEAHKALRYSLLTPSRWTGVLRRNTFARAIQGSNSIEGYLVSKEDALAAAEGEEPLDAEGETWQAVTGYRNALNYVLQLSKDPDLIFNEGYLRSFHFMMVQHDLTKHPGNWRPGPVFVRDEQKGETVYEGPPAEMVPRFMAELCAYLQSTADDEQAVVKAAMAHLNLVMIHPFSDGNGRMGRCLQTFVLARRGMLDPAFSSIEEYLGRNTREYYGVLAKVGQGSWHPDNDSRPWVRFNLTAHYRQAKTLMGRTRMIAKLWDQLENEIKQRNLPDRVIYALSDAAMGLSIRSAHYRNAAEVSNIVASRDLKALVDSGLLTAAGEKRGRTYASSDQIRRIWQEIRNSEPRRIPDPFGSEGGR